MALIADSDSSSFLLHQTVQTGPVSKPPTMESSLTELCPQCRLFEDDLEIASLKEGASDAGVELADSIWALQRSAKDGCVLCRLVYQAILYEMPGILQDDDLCRKSIRLNTYMLHDYSSDEGDGDEFEDNPNAEGDGDKAVVGASIQCGSPVDSNSDGGLDTPRIGMMVTLHMHDLQPLLETLLETPDYGQITTLSQTDSNGDEYYSADGVEEIAKLGRKWLSDCCALHKVCNEGASPIVPTRLVDVGLDGEEMSPRLVITNGSEVYSEYATLSYAWGGPDLGIKTTFSNLQEMTRQINPSDLSKTIREAFIMTRKLGIRYIWVDALCILQARGSVDAEHSLDWSYEAARFGQYYESSILTIAATGATSASQGLFLHRAGQVGSFQPYTVKWRDGLDARFRKVTVYPMVPSWGRETNLSPLSDRGWAAQERLMSRRILHFAANCVCWECYELQATEGDPSGRVLGNFRGETYIGADLEKNARCLMTIPPESIQEMWFRYLQNYSRKKFTVVSDKLPALSALASRVQSCIEQPYLEGIFVGDNVMGLAWRSYKSFWVDDANRPAVPSWSWASAKGEVRVLTGTIESHMTDLTSLAHVSSMLSISGRGPKRLRARGILMETDLSKLKLTVPNPDSVDDDQSVLRQPFNEEIEDLPSNYTILYLDTVSSHDFPSGSFYCFLLGKSEAWLWLKTRVQVGVALVLKPTGRISDSVDEFRRIGILVLPYAEFEAEGMVERDIDLV